MSTTFTLPHVDASARTALDIARHLAENGVPIFLARPAYDDQGERDWSGGHGSTGYMLPNGWQHTVADPSVVDRWRPGDALCLVSGHGLDVLDVDSHHGGDEAEAGLREAGMWPRTYGTACTPSGGRHHLVAPLGVGSRAGIHKGLDVRAGRPDATGRGFIFIAPTIKLSKVTGELASYRWIEPPDLDALADGDDDCGLALAVMIEESRPSFVADVDDDDPMPWLTATTIPKGCRDEWLYQFAKHLRRADTSLSAARELMRRRWEDCEQPPGDEFTLATAMQKLDRVWAGNTPVLPLVTVLGPIPDPQKGEGARGTDTAKGSDTELRRVQLTCAAGIKVRPVHWLCADRIALGTLALIAGREGIGKSIVSDQLAADVTRGRLPGAHFGTPKSVVIATTEDSWEHTVVPRLMAAGAELSRVYRVDVTTALGVDTGLSLPRDMDGLGRVVGEVDAALIVLDPLMSRLDSKLDTHKDADVRLALEPLVTVADKTGAAILGLIHVNKSSSTDPLTTIMASRAFAAVARSVLFVMVDPDDEKTRLLGQPKNNLGSTDLPTKTFRIDPELVATTDEGDVWTGKLRWTGDRQQSIHDALQAAQESSYDRSATSEAALWLDDYLTSKGGTDDSATIKREGQKAGHSADALKRARQRIKAEVSSSGFPRRTYWTLPGTSAQSEQPSGST